MNRVSACAITWPGSRVIVGDIPGAPVLEIASHDPRAFAALPREARSVLTTQLRAQLTGADTIAILDETKADWR